MPTSSTPLVLVSGSGRSGTSSLAGTLKRLGLHVPQPEVEASETNPRGFYEPQWVIDFHKRHLKELALFNIDSRPAAVEIVARHVGTGLPTGELHEWLSGQLAEHDQRATRSWSRTRTRSGSPRCGRSSAPSWAPTCAG